MPRTGPFGILPAVQALVPEAAHPALRPPPLAGVAAEPVDASVKDQEFSGSILSAIYKASRAAIPISQTPFRAPSSRGSARRGPGWEGPAANVGVVWWLLAVQPVLFGKLLAAAGRFGEHPRLHKNHVSAGQGMALERRESRRTRKPPTRVQAAPDGWTGRRENPARNRPAASSAMRQLGWSTCAAVRPGTQFTLGSVRRGVFNASGSDWSGFYLLIPG